MIGGAVATGVIFGLIHAGSADAVFLVPLAFFGAAPARVPAIASLTELPRLLR